MGDCVVCFGEVEVDCKCWLFLCDVLVAFIKNGLECEEVLELGLNVYCVDEMMLYLMQCVMIWSLIILSSIFAMMGSNEIGR